MMENYEEYYEISELIVKYLRGELNDLEKERLSEWRSRQEANERLFQRLTKGQDLLEEIPKYHFQGREEAVQNFLKRISLSRPRWSTYRRYVSYAAAAILLTALLFYLLPESKNRNQWAVHTEMELMPGGNRAVLILEGGKEIDLDNAETGEIARQGHAVISKSKEGYIAYNLVQLGLEKNSQEVSYNTIATPRGGQYRLRLPDGSRVWLNAHSTLTFPIEFKGEERKVELKGEAFFEVQHIPGKPFRVESGKQTVEVLGTEFNVNGYSDEKGITTTLVNGRVKIKLNVEKGTSKIDDVTLAPGQKALVENRSNDILISEADIEESIAWKNGHFQFNDTDLGTIMRQIARWYDVDVEYRGDVAGIRFRGKIPRDVPASQVFEILKTSGINIETEGRKIIVSN